MTINTNPEDKFEFAGITNVSIAHAVHDTYTGFFPALLPILIEKLSLTNTAAGLLSVLMRIPSLLQPLIGHIADRRNLKIFIVLAPTLSGAAMSLLGVAPNYGILALFLVITGISSAFLHAIGPVLGSSFSGKQLGKGMSFWMVGGELGRALGPLITVTAIGYLTIEKFPWLMVGGGLTSAYLFVKFKDISTLKHTNIGSYPEKISFKKIQRIMLPISLLMVTHSLSNAVLTIFLPTFLRQNGASLWIAGASLTILEISGMVGALTAGSLSDLFGRRKMLAISYSITPVLIFIFLRTEGFWQILLLILLGFFAISVVPVKLAIVLENFSDNRSLANGIYMALSFAINATATVLVGLISDMMNIKFTFLISAVILILGLPVILLLPKSKRLNKEKD